MRAPELRLFEGEIIVDNFAGGGGASVGIEMALGRSPDIAINHDAEAVAMHAANHPTTQHFCEDVWDIDPVKVCAGRPVGLAWFSPDCKHFSKAKGGKPVEKKIRGLAWIVVKWAKAVKPRVIILENVEEFADWGPLVERDGKMFPDPMKKGLTFRRWIGNLRGLGYEVDWQEMAACDFGAPTTRKRLFLVARCDGKPITWPKPTHSEGGHGGLKPWRTAAECIDFTIPTHSIFLTPEEAKRVGVKRPLADNTMRRIARGIKKFVIDSTKPYIVKVNHGYDQFRGQSLDDPLQTLTSKLGYGMVTPIVAKFRGDSAGSSVEAPLPTITAGPKKNPAGAAHALGLVTPYIARIGQTGSGDGKAYDVDEPLTTITSKAEHLLIGPHLAGVGGRKGQSPETGVEQPYHTITAKADTVVVAPYFVPRYGEREGQEPRAVSIEQPHPTIVPTQNGAQLVAAFMAQHNTDNVGHDMEEPVSTIVGKGCTQGLVAAHISPFYGLKGNETRSGDLFDPLPTVTADPRHAVVASNLVKLKGTSQHGQPNDEPLHTVQAGGNHYAEVRAFLARYNGQSIGQTMHGPMSTLDTTDRLGLVIVEGQEYVIVDIGMRMLAPRELFNAQGLPPNYVIDIVVKGRPLPKDAQVRMVGNSVSPYPACALVIEQFAEQEAKAVA